MLKPTTPRVSAIAAIVLLLPLAAAAQTGLDVRRPYRGLFGGDPNDSTASTFQVALSGAYDDNMIPQEGDPLDSRFQKKGYFGSAQAMLDLQAANEKGSYSLTATTGFRYYADNPELASAAHGATAQTLVRPFKRTTLEVGGGLFWTPMYTPVLVTVQSPGFDGMSDPITVQRWSGDYSIADRPSLHWSGSTQLTYSLSRKTSVLAGYVAQSGKYQQEDRRQRHDSATAGLSYRTTRYSTLRAGYTYTTYQTSASGSRRELHDFIAGIDYNRPFSLSGRRTTFTVTPGWTLVERESQLVLHLAGSATLHHEIGRSWTATGRFHRGVQYIDGTDQEMLANSLAVTVGGLASRRIQIDFSGELIADDGSEGSSGYRSYIGAAQVSYAIKRSMKAFAHYTFYNYRFDDVLALPANVAPRMERQGIRVGITVWTPVLR